MAIVYVGLHQNTVQCWDSKLLLKLRIPLYGDSAPGLRTMNCIAATLNSTAYDVGDDGSNVDPESSWEHRLLLEVLAQAMGAYLTLTLLLGKFAMTTLHNMLRKKRRHRATLLQLKLEIDEIDDVEDATAAFDRLTHGQKHLARQRCEQWAEKRSPLVCFRQLPLLL